MNEIRRYFTNMYNNHLSYNLQRREIQAHLQFKFFLNLGIQLHDTCGSIRLTQRHLFQIITATREPNNVLTLPEFTQGPGGRSSFSLGPPLLGKFYDLKCCYITPQ